MQCFRPELAKAVYALGKYLNGYTREHVVLAKRVLRYTAGTRKYGVMWEKPATPDLHFTEYGDADLRNAKDNLRSLSRFVLQMNGYTHAYTCR